jgi:hypothetical protein
MRDDFSEYVAARWPTLVRSAVLLGCSHPESFVAQSSTNADEVDRILSRIRITP